MTEQQADLIPSRPGARLRHEREARGLSIEEVAASTRIRERIIRAIERDETDEIAPVYLRGYVKAYAAGLGLDARELDEETRASAGNDPELRSVFAISQKRGAGERWLKAGSYLVATLLIAALVWQVTQQAVQFAEGGAETAAVDTTANDSDEPLEPTIGEEARTPRQSTHLNASIASLENLRKPPVNTGSAAEQAWSAINEPAPGEPLSGQPPNGETLPGEPGMPVITISVSADSWVEIVDATGKQLERDLLRGGNERSYRGEPPFELMLGRASAVVVEYQGEPVDIAPHIRGDVARLTLGEGAAGETLSAAPGVADSQNP